MRVGLNVKSPSHIIIIIVYDHHLHSLSLFRWSFICPQCTYFTPLTRQCKTQGGTPQDTFRFGSGKLFPICQSMKYLGICWILETHKKCNVLRCILTCSSSSGVPETTWCSLAWCKWWFCSPEPYYWCIWWFSTPESHYQRRVQHQSQFGWVE